MCSSCGGSNASQQYTCSVSSFNVDLRKATSSPNLLDPSMVNRGCLSVGVEPIALTCTSTLPTRSSASLAAISPTLSVEDSTIR
eukprot:CAMPEP_0171195614 /NCGR_PEP_ID=MMETSP0790-20130122/21484_1 /TAXON_ID=2925 /ORGANISM="Alexandrium catenella, Strain OF101" /LENGTH=83 /DNA_ID=CAMNT_0011660825 /DNA_START=387 /DNA_END=634 /DNA_ORIENTATION=+